jgi:hypothetical protein
LAEPCRNRRSTVAGGRRTVDDRCRIRKLSRYSSKLDRVDGGRRCDRPRGDQPVNRLERRQLPTTLLATGQMGLNDGAGERI